jgi:hypothetical protein
MPEDIPAILKGMSDIPPWFTETIEMLVESTNPQKQLVNLRERSCLRSIATNTHWYS